ncbi:MAG: CRISPR-associated endonuclease Cas1 [Thermoanaerobaculia bacterium]
MSPSSTPSCARPETAFWSRRTAPGSLDVPCLKLDGVLLFGNVQVTTQALVELLDHGIELALFSLGGRLRGQLTPPKAKNVLLRVRQYELHRDQAFCLRLSRELVVAKIANAASVLRRHRANAPETVAAAEAAEIERAVGAARAAVSLDVLRGIEGAATRRYFRALAGIVPPAFAFEGRSRRPPRDPCNALLSFGYVLVGNELQALLDGIGFDPYIGFFHQLDYGRPSLALDLVEEFRAPLVDRLSATLLNRGELAAGDFAGTPERGIVLTREALKRYLAAYERELTEPRAVEGEQLSFRQLFRRQAERLARALTAGEPYRSFRLPC